MEMDRDGKLETSGWMLHRTTWKVLLGDYLRCPEHFKLRRTLRWRAFSLLSPKITRILRRKWRRTADQSELEQLGILEVRNVTNGDVYDYIVTVSV